MTIWVKSRAWDTQESGSVHSLFYKDIKNMLSRVMLYFLKYVNTYVSRRRKNNSGKAFEPGLTFFIGLIVTFHKSIRLYGKDTPKGKI